MFSAVVLACYALLPAGTPFIPLLGLFWLWRRGALQSPRLSIAVIVVLAALALVEISGVTVKGIIQYALCLSCVVIFARVAEKFIDHELVTLTAVIAGISIGAVIVHAGTGGVDLMFALSDQGEIRYRFLFSEPNVLVSFVFLPAIVFHDELKKRSFLFQAGVMVGLFVTTAAAGSPLGYFGFLLYAFNFVVSSGPRGRAAGIACLIVMTVFVTTFLPENIAVRLDAIANGEDNSLNLRTWGALAIAETTLQDFGRLPLGVGLGAGRQVLEGSPYLVLFAADQAVLPNFVATLLLETGLLGVTLVVTLWGAILVRIRRNAPALLGLIFVIANCCTSSFFFDYFSWAAFGLCFGVGNRSRASAAGRLASPLGVPRRSQLR